MSCFDIFYGIYGAAIARLITEFFLLIWRFIDITKINVKLNIVKYDSMCHCCRYDVYCAWCGQSLFASYNVRYAAINCDWYSSLSLLMMTMKNQYVWQILRHLRHKTILSIGNAIL